MDEINMVLMLEAGRSDAIDIGPTKGAKQGKGSGKAQKACGLGGKGTPKITRAILPCSVCSL
jgi:hypothetical protein